MNLTNIRPAKGRSLIETPSTFVVFDIETTGLDSLSNEIIEIGALKVKDGKVVDTFDHLIKPSHPISDFITNLTGITNEMVETAETIEEVLTQFINFIGDNILMGHNVNFDINFVYDHAEKYNNHILNNDFIDTLRLARKLLPELSHHRLSDLADYYNIDKTGHHRALKDVEMTLEVYNHLVEEILNQYGNIDNFKKQIYKNSYDNFSDLTPQTDKIDKNNIFYDKNIAITGNFVNLPRKEAVQKILNLGGHYISKVTEETDYLIEGSKRSRYQKNPKSTKQLQAEKLISEGVDIKILTEEEFLKIINEDLS